MGDKAKGFVAAVLVGAVAYGDLYTWAGWLLFLVAVMLLAWPSEKD